MMKARFAFVLLILVGLMGTAVGVGAAGLTTKVSGLLRKDVTVVVNGLKSDVQPVFINGKAYLPVREVAATFDYGLNWNDKNKTIILWDKEKMIHTEGVVVNTSQQTNGSVNFELLGKSVQGPRSIARVILSADSNTQVTDITGRTVALETLNMGSHIIAHFGPAVLNSNPPQAYAFKLIVGSQRLVRDGTVHQIQTINDFPQLVIGEDESSTKSDLILNVVKDTMLVTSEGQTVSIADIKPGKKIRAYYGSDITKSNPQQSNADVIIYNGVK